jgi:Fe-S cluster biogenesis protein NfuA
VLELSEGVVRTLREVVAPLVEADGGVLYVLRRPTTPPGAQPGLGIHLAGTCAGCPGVKTTTYDIIEPALRAAGLKGEIDVTAGWIVPNGAERVTGGSGQSPQSVKK